jgi:exopolysaccharide production protein ExoY
MEYDSLRVRQQPATSFQIWTQSKASAVPACGGRVKRLFDIGLSLVAIILLSPLFIGLALAIRISDAGPVFFGQPRVGLNGRTFRIWKFRSMVPDAAARLREHLDRNPQAAIEWQANRKLRNDPRITPLEYFLRKFSIDELPQLFNILAGEMSFVGPQPVDAAECARYGRSLRHYMRTRPGLTGMWQVSGRSDVSYQRRVALDRYYVSHWSLLLDLLIILKTVPVVLTGRGSY